MRKVTELEAAAISKEHRNAVRSCVDTDDDEWFGGKAVGIERTLQMLGIKFDIEGDGSLSFRDIAK